MSDRIITVSTKGHLQMAKELSAEINKYTDYKLEICDLDSSCEGIWGTVGFFNSCFAKIDFILKTLHEQVDESYLIYLDSDVCIFKNVVDEMKKQLDQYDICFQRDGGSTYCAGMFICRKNAKTIAFFENVLDTLQSNIEYYVGKSADQTAVNEMLPHSNLKYSMLGPQFTTYGNIGGNLWTVDSPSFNLDSDVVAFHANFTIGLENKTLLLDLVRNKVKYN